MKDMERWLTKSTADTAGGDGFLRRLGIVATPGFLLVLLYRLAHLLYARGWRRLARLGGNVNRLLFKATITPDSCIGAGMFVPHPVGILFHGRAGERLTLYSLSVCSTVDACSGLDESPRLGNRVTIDVHAAILGPVSVGDDSRVGFRTVVQRDIPNDSIAIAKTLHGPRPNPRDLQLNTLEGR